MRSGQTANDVMNIEKLIKDEVEKIQTSGGKVYVSPDIPEKKLNGALSAIAYNEVDAEYVLAIFDTSLFGSGKAGCVFLGDRVYFNNSGRKETILFEEISEVTSERHVKTDEQGNEKAWYEYTLVKKDGTQENITELFAYSEKNEFAKLFNRIAESGKEEGVEFESTNQVCPLAMMEDEIKLGYLKLICNYAYADDDEIDPVEYSEIMTLVVINEIGKEQRLLLRGYMAGSTERKSDDELIADLTEHVEKGSLDALKMSVMKDVLNLWRKKSQVQDWNADENIVSLQKKLAVPDEQVDCILETILENEKILSDRKSDIEIKKSLQEIASKSAAVGVPLAAVYLSGSVIGISAAGMTSGLATLGMGGVLGFSSMFTGLGVAVLLGVGAYKGMKKVTGMGDLEKNKQRELMLQQIVKNSQRALNYLVEDVNAVTAELQEVIRKGQETDIKISKLSAMLSMMSKSAQGTTNQISYAQREKVLCHLPERISEERINELASGATKKNLRDLISMAYCESRADEEGNVRDGYLNLDLDLDTLEKVAEVLEGIGYYRVMDASLATAKSAAKSLVKGLLG